MKSYHLSVLAEPDNEASMNCPSSRPCSPIHNVQELHAKLSSSPPRSSPLRTGPTYTLKKGVRFSRVQLNCPNKSCKKCLYFHRITIIVLYCPIAQMLLGTKKKKQSRFRSVISDIFDGSILSLVQCLTCDRVREHTWNFLASRGRQASNNIPYTTFQLRRVA